jgi:hypothetical protein
VSLEFREFAESMGIKLFNSSPYYAQANGQAEASNKIMIKLIQKKIDQKPRRWHSVLSEALWAYRMTLMEQQKRLLMNWFMGTMRFFFGVAIRFQESGFAKGFKLQGLQWHNDGRTRGFAHDTS